MTIRAGQWYSRGGKAVICIDRIEIVAAQVHYRRWGAGKGYNNGRALCLSIADFKAALNDEGMVLKKTVTEPTE